MRTEQLPKVIIAIIMVAATVHTAAAFTITDAGDNWRSLTDNLVITSSDNNELLHYYNGSGYVKTSRVWTAGRSYADEYLNYGVQENTGVFGPEDLWLYCDAEDKTLCVMDYPEQITTDYGNSLPSYNPSLYNLTLEFVNFFNMGFATYTFLGANHTIYDYGADYNRTITHDAPLCGDGPAGAYPFYKRTPTLFNPPEDDEVIYACFNLTVFPPSSELLLVKAVHNQTHIITTQTKTVTGAWNDPANTPPHNTYCLNDPINDTVYCKGNSTDTALLWDKNNTVTIPYTNFTRDGDTFTAQYYHFNRYGGDYYELFIDESGRLRHYHNGTDTLQGVNITPYNAGGYAEAMTRTVTVGPSIIYPTAQGVYEYYTPGNVTGVAPSVIASVTTSGTGDNKDLAYSTDLINYVLRDSVGGSQLVTLDTQPDSTTYIQNITNVTGAAGITLQGSGRAGTGFTSLDYQNLIVGTTNNMTRYYDMDDYPNITTTSFVANNLKKVYGFADTSQVPDVAVLRVSGSTSYWDVLEGPSTYPGSGGGEFFNFVSDDGPIDFDYAGSSGTVHYFPAYTHGTSGPGLDMCVINLVSYAAGCDNAATNTRGTYPTGTPQAIGTGGTRLVAYKNTTHFATYNFTKSLGTTFNEETVCKNPGAGSIRSVFYLNTTTALAGTTQGELLVCDLENSDPDTNTVAHNIGDITDNNESILRIISRRAEDCYDNDCDEENRYHILSTHTYAMIELTAGGAAPPTTPPTSYCGDTTCDVGETVLSCPQDCPAVCGDTYCTHNETAQSCPSDCGGEGQNQTVFYNWSTQGTGYNGTGEDSELRSLLVVDNTYSVIAGLIAGNQRVRKVYSENGTSLTQATLLDYPYDLDKVGDWVFVATDNEAHALDGYNTDNLVVQETDGYLFKSDILPGVAMLNETYGYVSDNGNEADYWTPGSNPTGSLGKTCYDLLLQGDILFCDSDDEGITLYNATNPTSLSLLDEYDHRTYSTWTGEGDRLSVGNNRLLTTRNLYSMTLFDTTDPSNISIIASCNTGGITLLSVEYVNDELLLGGGDESELVTCNSTNTNETTNNDWEYLSEHLGEPLVAIETSPDGLIHVLSTTQYHVYNYTLENATSNDPPTLAGYTVSSQSVDEDEPVDFTVTAGDLEPEDVAWYGIKCNGTETSYTANTNGLFTCTWSSAGTYNTKVAVSDNFHLPTWYNETTIPINVSAEPYTGGTLRVVVLTQAQEAIENATVLLTATSEELNTSEYGTATFSTDTTGLYEIYTSKDGYYTDVSNYYADGVQNAVTLYPVAGEGETQIVVTVQDTDADPVEGALVSYVNEFTFQYDYTWSNALGKAFFTDVDEGDTIVTASKDDSLDTHISVVIVGNSTNPVTITLSGQDFTGGTTHEDRNCRDSGVWLCGPSSIVENACTTDSECLSDFCTPGTNKCSRFNYSYCDTIDYPRNQQCVIQASANLTLSNVTNWLLGNLLYVIIIMIVVIGIGFIAVSWAPKR